MHFFGTLGTLSFLIGFLLTAKLFWDKIDALFYSKIPIKRDITEQPIFFIALVAVVIGVQLFVTGFLAEMFAMQSLRKREYLVIEKIGVDEIEANQHLPA
jgi:predicted membrane protein